MLNYLWSRFTASESAKSATQVPPQARCVYLPDGTLDFVSVGTFELIESLKRDLQLKTDAVSGYLASGEKKDAQIAALKRDLTHKTDLAESYKGATERRDERVADLEQQVEWFKGLDGQQKWAINCHEDNSKRLTKRCDELGAENESMLQKLAAIEAILHPNLSPKGDKTDGDTAEYPAPVNAIADTTSHGE